MALRVIADPHTPEESATAVMLEAVLSDRALALEVARLALLTPFSRELTAAWLKGMNDAAIKRERDVAAATG